MYKLRYIISYAEYKKVYKLIQKKTFFTSVYIILFLLLGLIRTQAQTDQQIWQWMDQIGGTGEEMSGGLLIDEDNTIYLGGSFSRQIQDEKQPAVSAGKQDMFVAAWSENHKKKWLWTAGNKGNDKITAMVLLPEKTILIAGNTSSGTKLGKHIITDAGKFLFLAKLNNKGECFWSKTLEYTKSASLSLLKADTDDNIYAVGTYSDSLKVGEKNLLAKGKRDIFILKINSSGEVDRLISLGNDSDECPSALATDSNEQVYLAFNFTSAFTIQDIRLQVANEEIEKNTCLVQFDSDLKLKWHKLLSALSSVNITSLQVDWQNRIYLIGSFSPDLSIENENLVSHGNSDIFLARFNSYGEELLLKQFGSPKAEYAGSLLSDKLGGIILTGAFNDTMQIDSIQLCFDGTFSNGFVVQFSEKDKIQWAKQISSMESSYGRFAALNSEGNLYLAGEFRDLITNENMSLKSNGQTDVYIAKFHNCESGEDVITGDGPLCPGTSLILSTNSKFHEAIWNDTILNSRKIEISEPGAYWIKIIDKKGCTLHDTVKIKLAEQPLPYLGNDTIVDISETLVLNPGSAFKQYIWQDNTDDKTYLAEAPKGETGIVDYYVTVIDSFGCSGNDTITIKYIDKTPWIDLNENALNTFPNPVENWLNWSIQCDKPGKLQVELTSASGNTVYYKIIPEYIPGQILQIDMKQFKPGVYYLSVSNPKRTLTEPIIYE